MAWLALILQFRLILQNGPFTWMSQSMLVTNFFSYFTILSNLLVAVSSTLSLIFPRNPAGIFFSRTSVRTAIAVYIFIVGLVYNLVLRQIWSPTGLQLLADNLLHVGVPVAYLLFWFAAGQEERLSWKQMPPWLIFPAVYLVYSLIRGAMTGWYPYPFLNAARLGYAKVAFNALGVLLAILITGTGLIALNRVLQKKAS